MSKSKREKVQFTKDGLSWDLSKREFNYFYRAAKVWSEIKLKDVLYQEKTCNDSLKTALVGAFINKVLEHYIEREAKIKQGLADIANGRVKSRGSFKKYLSKKERNAKVKRRTKTSRESK